MQASEDILHIWRKFDHFPIETLTKAWYSQLDSERRQRSVALMKEHRDLYGTSGNCYDLALWLIDEFRYHKLHCYGINTPDSHVAVVVLDDRGFRYLCDLGDQWVQPILIDPRSENYTEDFVDHFFPGASVKLASSATTLEVTYRRPNGKEMHQTYNLIPVPDAEIVAQGEATQRRLHSPLVEKRIFTDKEVIHWEYDDGVSFFSTMNGKQIEPSLGSIEEWAERISGVSGIRRTIVQQALEVYSKVS